MENTQTSSAYPELFECAQMLYLITAEAEIREDERLRFHRMAADAIAKEEDSENILHCLLEACREACAYFEDVLPDDADDHGNLFRLRDAIGKAEDGCKPLFHVSELKDKLIRALSLLEECYPQYHQSDFIAECDDLIKRVDGER